MAKKTNWKLGWIGIINIVMFLIMGLVVVINNPGMNLNKAIFRDANGNYAAQSEIDVFKSNIAPGSEGNYSFEVENPYEWSLKYSVKLSDDTSQTQGLSVPLTFRLKMNNVYVHEEEEWIPMSKFQFTNFIFPSNSVQHFTLEWKWNFNGGTDELDTLLGDINGKYRLVFFMQAEINP